ncbi:Rossmann-like domain-containing protein [uncultured Sphaerochaeta sp.]|uniref:Rossmann-like domain-containing protein n=1 Tax=uncultured Sphaerochaeta sp. TaxID=886478 RepID=UPI0029CA0C82|nr:DUF364 domain-containing protein [uncultured Sphaerochaeta sp.]
MDIDNRIHTYFQAEAESLQVESIYLGLGYSAVVLQDGRCGLCYTPKGSGNSCSVNKNKDEYERYPAIKLLKNIKKEDPLGRAMAIALCNALNQDHSLLQDEDDGNLIRDLKLNTGDNVAMIGYFAPIVSYLNTHGITVRVYDIGKEVGSEEEFYQWAETESDALILTATSLINSSLEEVLSHFNGNRIPTVLMGPSTIMAKELYRDLPIDLLAGSTVSNRDGVIKSIRNGRGTPYLHKDCKKVCLYLQG